MSCACGYDYTRYIRFLKNGLVRVVPTLTYSVTVRFPIHTYLDLLVFKPRPFHFGLCSNTTNQPTTLVVAEEDSAALVPAA